MPNKLRYWRNPQKWRAESRNRRAKLTALGIPFIKQLSLEAQENKRLGKIKWCKENRAANKKSQLKYRRKLQRLFGSCSARAMWLHHQLKEAQNAAARKAALHQIGKL